MILSPPVLALLCCSLLVCALALVATGAGVAAAVGWDPESWDARQLARERRALLAETALALVLAWQMVSLFLFVATAERLHPLLPGAMCAAGTLNASRFGYPALGLKTAGFVLAGLWLVVHRASPGAAGTGLVRAKHLSLVPLSALLVAENGVQLRFFADLDPAVITSCCATVFAEGGGGLGAGLASLPTGATRASFFGLLASALVAGGCSVSRRRSPAPFSVLAVLLGAAGLAALVAWVAPAVYQLPTHHCPFCLLSADHGRVGYALYLLLAAGVLAGGGSGLVHALRRLDPEGSIRPGVERRLCLASMAGFGLFTLVSLWPTAALGLRTLQAVGP